MLLSALAAAEPKHDDVGGIAIRLSGFESDSGVAVCSLFTKDGWLQAGRGQPRKVAIKNHSATCEFANVRFGTYAVAAFHDEDGDGKVDRRLGIPVEDYCFSNRATPKRLKPPSFDDAKFEHGRAQTQEPCELR